jgi:Lrp/AsnC family transcriptional regulator, leucine-responsive regulatory protein
VNFKLLYIQHNRKKGTVVKIEQFSEVQAKILKQLLVDGRKSEKEIAAATGVSEQIVKKNYQEMEKKGVITGATTHINYKLFGYQAVSYISINVHSQQADNLIKYLRGMPDVYAVYSTGIGGSVDCLLILRTFEQLNEVKDCIKRNFSVLEMKTSMWTGVREMNYNIAITEGNRKNKGLIHSEKNSRVTANLMQKTGITLDEIDLKMADLLTENGRIPIEALGEKLGLPTSTAKRKFERLKNNGALKVTIQISPYKIGYRALGIFFVVTSDEESSLIIDQLSEIPDIISIMKTSGDYDLQIYAMLQDLDQLLNIQESMGKIPGIIKLDTELYRFSEKWIKWPTPRQYMSTL